MAGRGGAGRGSLAGMPIDADTLWTWHRAALGGRSSVTGATLPETLAGAPPGARLAHWAMAAGVARANGWPEPPIPPGCDPAEVARVRAVVAELVPCTP